jgi:type II secretory pathway component PulJ
MFGNSIPAKTARKTVRAWTLVEMLISLGIFSICGAAIASLFVYGTQTFAALYNYATLDALNRNAMDTMTREIRQALAITSYNTNPATLTLVNGDGNTVVYTFNPNTSQLERSIQGDPNTHVLLTNCTLLQFELYKRNPSNATYNLFPVATQNWSNEVKVIQLTWKTSMNVCPTTITNSENVQTARIVIRKAKVTD